MPLVKCELCDAQYMKGDMNHPHELQLALERGAPLPWWLAEARPKMLKARGIMPLAHESEEDC
jgi:hypothetical protein